MIKRKTAIAIRKTHRYLGLFIGIQFIMWTVSGIYFSWTDIDEIHGDHFKKEQVALPSFRNLRGISEVMPELEVKSLELKDIAGEPFYLVNGERLINAETGEIKSGVSEEEAVFIAEKNMISGLEVVGIEKIEETSNHHEYRGSPLPAYVISYAAPKNLRSYISVKDGSFRTVRFRDWRWFDFLWMTHTMDYEGRDNFNNTLLRAFSVMGLLTVLSGFVLWYISSPTMRKLRRKTERKKS